MEEIIYQPKNKIRIVTCASLFDGHDAAINIMRRIIQSSGAEVIHLGHNRSVQELVNCAIQEDVQGIAITSYQGGHVEYFKYAYDLLKEKNASDIKIFGGGGGVILPQEIKELHAYGITRIYSPDDGRTLGLQGMINDLLQKCDFPTGKKIESYFDKVSKQDHQAIAKVISGIENDFENVSKKIESLKASKHTPIIGFTGTGGAGKSSLVDEIVRRFSLDFPEKKIAILSVDPTKRSSGGALLGDRIRMNSIFKPNIYMRSLGTRQSNASLSKAIKPCIDVLQSANFDLIIVESSGIGQSDSQIVDCSDIPIYVMTPEYGAATQLEKIDMLDLAQIIVINKFDKKASLDALRDVRKQVKRSKKLFEVDDSTLPVFGTIASQFNDPGVNHAYLRLLDILNEKFKLNFKSNLKVSKEESEKITIIPPSKVRYLSEISDLVSDYNKKAISQSLIMKKVESLENALTLVTDSQTQKNIDEVLKKITPEILPETLERLKSFEKTKADYQKGKVIFKVREKELKAHSFTESLSHTKISKIALPRFISKADLVPWLYQENVPGEFPYTAGVYPLKREEEDPTRMFAGEGNPERTNKRFHYVSKDLPAKRLSTAFDSVTLYGEDPDLRPDIYGKIGNAGVSVCCLDDAKKLYSGFDLCNPKTSVSMTINGPAPMVTAFFLNTAIDQMCEKYIKEQGLQKDVEKKLTEIFKKYPRPKYEDHLPPTNDGLGLMLLGTTGDQVLENETYEKIKADALTKVRGTVQADILKEDQAQNTCIFSTEFALRMMGDMQENFIKNKIRNFYSVSISGYHIAEAGANPISQLAFTLANGFTYVEYYLSRGMKVDDFAPNISFFFSNGIDPEYAVIGRVARRIWAKAMKYRYGGNDRSQKLKYHIQTSGRSLHAQEISFNDIRTTLQALYAIYDNCNSLHTNAYDEAITTPTEESVRRAMAIQLIINRELGLAKNENPLQGSFIIEELTDLVEEAVMAEFNRLTDRGGVLGAMETMYQRSKIQEESLYYETLKHQGKLPIIGVNTFLSSEGSPTIIPKEVIRSSENEKKLQIATVKNLHDRNMTLAHQKLEELKKVSLDGKNIFSELMETVKVCTLGQISHALYQVGGQYRRNM